MNTNKQQLRGFVEIKPAFENNICNKSVHAQKQINLKSLEWMLPFTINKSSY